MSYHPVKQPEVKPERRRRPQEFTGEGQPLRVTTAERMRRIARRRVQPAAMSNPALAQCCICRTTTKRADEDRPLPEGWVYRTITVDVGRYYCPEHAHRA
jgi:hypothetical protein